MSKEDKITFSIVIGGVVLYMIMVYNSVESYKNRIISPATIEERIK